MLFDGIPSLVFIAYTAVATLKQMKVGERLKQAAHDYCGECRKGFSPGEIVYYTWYENLTFCSNCKTIMNQRVTPSYLDWQERKMKGAK